MREPKSFSALTRFAAVALFVAVAGSGLALWTGYHLSNQTDSIEQPSPPPHVGQSQVYWLKTDALNQGAIAFVPVPQNTPPAPSVLENRQRALQSLLQDSPPSHLTTTIPPQTRLLRLQETPQGVELDLSQAFTSGGGSASMIGRLGQILYTASLGDRQQPIWLRVEGDPLTVLGGEGLEVSYPMTVAEFEQEFLTP